MPLAMMIDTLKGLSDEKKFRAGNCVFIAPDERLAEIRSAFLKHGIRNDVFGVREAKGLEFPSVAVIGFFEYFEHLGTLRQWENVIRWLYSEKSLSNTDSGEKISGKYLENCDYLLTVPELEDQAMMLYTAMTRARGSLYFIEVNGSSTKGKKVANLADFAFRQFQNLDLLKVLKPTESIDEGEADMTPEQHKVRGVLLVVQAVNMSRNNESTKKVKKKFEEAAERFKPDKGNDKDLLDQCNKHLRAFEMHRAIIETLKSNFFNKDQGAFDLRGKLPDVLQFETDLAEFVQFAANDSFLVDEIQDTRERIQQCFYETPYETHFAAICDKIREFEM